jgi:AmiR/NasT family two-component response regulator
LWALFCRDCTLNVIARARAAYNSSPSIGLRVLVAESSWHVAKLVEQALVGLGMEIIGPVARAAEAKRLLAAHAPHFAVIGIRLRDGMFTENDLKKI